jgi:hypothetical protein
MSAAQAKQNGVQKDFAQFNTAQTAIEWVLPTSILRCCDRAVTCFYSGVPSVTTEERSCDESRFFLRSVLVGLISVASPSDL